MLPVFGPEDSHRCSQTLQPSAGARKKPFVGLICLVNIIKDKQTLVYCVEYCGMSGPRGLIFKVRLYR